MYKNKTKTLLIKLQLDACNSKAVIMTWASLKVPKGHKSQY